MYSVRGAIWRPLEQNQALVKFSNLDVIIITRCHERVKSPKNSLSFSPSSEHTHKKYKFIEEQTLVLLYSKLSFLLGYAVR